MNDKKQKIVIVGGGFGGVKAALELCEDRRVAVTLVSDHSHFRYYPTLYRAATGGKRAGSSIRLGNMLENKHIAFIKDVATELDRKNKRIETKDGQQINYDVLILALGNVTNYFGVRGLQEFSYGIKSTEEAEELRRRLHEQFIESGGPDQNYVIVGGGPTGIELAGALPSYLREVMKRHDVEDTKLNITLVEALPRLLPRSPKKISTAVADRLRKLGVTVMLGKAVEGQTATTLMVGGKPLESRTVIWTAGVTNHPFFRDNKFNLTQRGKVTVNEYLQAEPDIYILGDNADTQYSGMAQTALHDGKFVAENIKRQVRGQMPKKYIPKKPISVIPVGPRWAAVEWGKAQYTGFVGWVLRSFADLIAFTDLHSLIKAGKQWMQTMGDEKMNCPDCNKKTAL